MNKAQYFASIIMTIDDYWYLKMYLNEFFVHLCFDHFEQFICFTNRRNIDVLHRRQLTFVVCLCLNNNNMISGGNDNCIAPEPYSKTQYVPVTYGQLYRCSLRATRLPPSIH